MLCRQSKADQLGGGQRGPVDARAQWTCLRPVRWLDESERPVAPVMEVVSICKANVPGLVTNHGHAFVRLIDCEGGVRPIGFFPDESTGIEPDDYPGLRMPGMLLLPDKYDRIAWNPLITRISLHREDFDRICGFVESLQNRRDEGSLSFDLLDRSCVGFVVRMARLAGVRVEAETWLTDFIGGESAPSRLTPASLARRIVPRSLYRLLFNLMLSAHGGFCTVSRQWQGETERYVLNQITGIRPVFSRLWEIWSRHVPFYHVRALREWQRAVELRGLDAYRIDEG
ncbi:hypothetical protein GCM10007874_44970 [Labrys miyagiensis]|uniref:DUF4105 domain-containing protein n=1 Tax=Labrys miyagiensis TaxID=346912 RepID=A0ABQ6CNU4_9HYPH|nr:hypothetical protein [Labrys miyagiensis]GLS21480.1 hypothetical protein GCM10007874_44970 [Labrys miyagiensis]